MSLKIDKVQLDIIINNDPARKALRVLTEDTIKIQKEMKGMKKDTDEWNAALGKLKDKQTQIENLKKEIGIAGMTMKELKNHQRELNMVMAQMNPNIPQYKVLEGELQETNARIKQLTTSSRGLSAQLENQGNVFSRFFGSVGAKVKEWGATVATAFTVTSIVGFFKEGIQSSIKMADAMKLLKMSLDGNNASYKEYVKVADQMSKTTIYKKSEILEAEKFLAIQGRTVPEMKKVMAAAQELATVQGITLEEATRKMDATYSGVVDRSIKKLGVEFRNLSLEQVKNGEVMDLIISKYGGRAAEELDTTHGRIVMLVKAWDGLKRGIGDLFTNSGNGGFNGVITVLTNVIKVVRDNINVIVSSGKVLFALAGAYKATTLAIAGWNSLMEIKNSWDVKELFMTNAKKVARLAENAELMKSAINKIALTDATKAMAIATLYEKDATVAATVAQKELNVATKANPWGLIIAGIVAAGVALYSFLSKEDELNKFQGEMNNKLAAGSASFEVLKEALLKSIPGTKERSELIKKMNADYGDLIGHQLSEADGNDKIAKSLKGVNEKLRMKILIEMENAASTEFTTKIEENNLKIKELLQKNREGKVSSVFTVGIKAKIEEENADLKKGLNDRLNLIKQEEADVSKSMGTVTEKIKSAKEQLKEYAEEWKNMTLDQLESIKESSIKGGINQAGDYTKDELALLNKLIREKKKSYNEEESDYKKYKNEFEKLQEEMHGLINEDFTEKLSKYDKEIYEVNQHYNKLIDAEKKYIKDVGKLPKAKQIRLQPQVDTAKGNIDTLEAAKQEQYNKIIVNAETNLSTEVKNIREKLKFAKMSLQDQEIYKIESYYDKLLLESRNAETAVYNEKLKAINNTKYASENDFQEAWNEANDWHQKQLLQIGKDEKEVLEEKQKQVDEQKKKFADKLYKDTLTDRDKELFDLKLKYDDELKLAGNNTQQILALQTEERIKQRDINNKFDKIEERERKETFDKKVALFKASGDAIGGIMALMAANGQKDAAFYKDLALTQVAIQTGVSIANGISIATQSGKTWYEVVAAILVVIGEVAGEMATASSYINSAKVPAYATGKYPVQGSDGKWYDAVKGGKSRTGMVNGPTTFLAGENGRELIIDGNTLGRMQMNYPALINAIYSVAGIHGGGSSGGGASTPLGNRTALGNRETDVMLLAAIMELNRRLGEPIRANVEYRDIKKVEGKVDKMNSLFNM